MFIPFCVYHYDTYMPLRRAHAHTCPQGSLMTPLWAKEAHTLGLGPNLTILPYLGLLLAFRASLVSARCRMVHRYVADIGVLTNYGQIGAALSTVSHIQAPSGQLLRFYPTATSRNNNSRTCESSNRCISKPKTQGNI